MAKKTLQYNLEYELENAVGSKTVTINDVSSDTATANAATFGEDLISYIEGDYSIGNVTLIEVRRTSIDID